MKTCTLRSPMSEHRLRLRKSGATTPPCLFCTDAADSSRATIAPNSDIVQGPWIKWKIVWRYLYMASKFIMASRSQDPNRPHFNHSVGLRNTRPYHPPAALTTKAWDP